MCTSPGCGHEKDIHDNGTNGVDLLCTYIEVSISVGTGQSIILPCPCTGYTEES